MLKSTTKLLPAFKKWSLQITTSRILIVSTFFLVLFAYLPTIQADYVTQDQWRAFRYSTNEEPPYSRAKACATLVIPFYFLTGRPLVWITECLEHTFVAKISDFKYLRPICLGIVAITVGYLGTTLAPFIGGRTMGIFAASVFVMTPGYSFMYLQSMPAAMVLISIILAALSFNRLRIMLGDAGSTFPLKKLWGPFLPFIFGCLIYPASTFSVVILAWVAFGFESNKSWPDRIKLFLRSLTFYFFSALIYFLFVKIYIALFFANIPSLGSYDVALQLSPSIIWSRVSEAGVYFCEMSPFNFHTPPGLPIILLALFSLKIGFDSYGTQGNRLSFAAASSILSFLVGGFVLLASISPWTFSRMDNLFTRHLFSWYLFFCASSVGLVAAATQNMTWTIRKWIPFLVLCVFVAPVSFVQHRLSSLEVAVSNIEIQCMRLPLEKWMSEKGWATHRYLLVVLPNEHRPQSIKKMLKGANAGENVVLSSSENLISIPWMLNALVREYSDLSWAKSVQIVNCAFDQKSARLVLANTTNVALVFTYGDTPVMSPVAPFVINMSALTSKPLDPTIELQK